MEVELIEPVLFFEQAQDAPNRAIDAILRRSRDQDERGLWQGEGR